jgi:hypothetical protein
MKGSISLTRRQHHERIDVQLCQVSFNVHGEVRHAHQGILEVADFKGPLLTARSSSRWPYRRRIWRGAPRVPRHCRRAVNGWRETGSLASGGGARLPLWARDHIAASGTDGSNPSLSTSESGELRRHAIAKWRRQRPGLGARPNYGPEGGLLGADDFAVIRRVSKNFDLESVQV